MWVEPGAGFGERDEGLPAEPALRPLHPGWTGSRMGRRHRIAGATKDEAAKIGNACRGFLHYLRTTSRRRMAPVTRTCLEFPTDSHGPRATGPSNRRSGGWCHRLRPLALRHGVIQDLRI